MNVMIGNRGLFWVVLIVFTGCAKTSSDEPVQLPAGPINIYYTSVRGASPRIVDSFVIISDPSVSPSDENGSECFFVPPKIAPFFKKALEEILTRYEWPKLESFSSSSADSAFRRFAISGQGYGKFVEFHEPAPVPGVLPQDSLLSEGFKRFFALVSEVRLLGEIYGVSIRVEDHPVFEKMGGPLLKVNHTSQPKHDEDQRANR